MGKMTTASIAAAGAAWGLHAWLESLLGAAGLGARMGAVLPAVVASGAVFAIACVLLRVRDFNRLLAVVKRRA